MFTPCAHAQARLRPPAPNLRMSPVSMPIDSWSSISVVGVAAGRDRVREGVAAGVLSVSKG